MREKIKFYLLKTTKYSNIVKKNQKRRRSDVFETIQKMVAEHLSISVDKVKPESDFITDLEADSLDIVEMLIAMENTFDIEFEDSEMVDIKTVQDVVNFIESRK